ncbi:hypothetical protein DFH08DRAFT_999767 [Mycena albidolilacea]|uniref:Uncharacterized protein n=1 Tax=Mycena albidolilacea TaxID=1033008 RepID=A0AAD7E759_9AGAR|nr:hypothetical protein DFH08DRAFT_999767 [Mycena albidolilacea]
MLARVLRGGLAIGRVLAGTTNYIRTIRSGCHRRRRAEECEWKFASRTRAAWCDCLPGLVPPERPRVSTIFTTSCCTSTMNLAIFTPYLGTQCRRLFERVPVCTVIWRLLDRMYRSHRASGLNLGRNPVLRGSFDREKIFARRRGVTGADALRVYRARLSVSEKPGEGRLESHSDNHPKPCSMKSGNITTWIGSGAHLSDDGGN